MSLQRVQLQYEEACFGCNGRMRVGEIAASSEGTHTVAHPTCWIARLRQAERARTRQLELFAEVSS